MTGSCGNADSTPSSLVLASPGGLHGPARTNLSLAARPQTPTPIADARSDQGREGTWYLDRLIGASRSMLDVHDLIRRVAHTDASVLITGETGTGKEVVAQAIHDLSRRRDQAFLPLNCGAVSATLSESELFGHERGSFTGADRLHRGYFERADRGTLFLDEIAEMPTELQVKLLRVLETSVVSRVGATTTQRVDVRVIAATNRPPEEAVADGRLREDLLYRLNVLTVDLPPLRERGADVLLLADQFLGELNLSEKTAKCFTPACLEQFREYHWPGNVRELRNVVQRSFILAGEVDVDCIVLPRPPRAESKETAWVAPGVPGLVVPIGSTIAEVERRLLLATLAHLGGDKVQAALVLGVSLKTMYNRLREYR
jgi:two-component system, NtrC family, response regulator AtoC